jgi:lysophospholipase L1-like esterase
MILFLGDSFTWGQGLQYIYLVEKGGWTWEDCQKIIPPNIRLERLGFNEDEFRKNNSFPSLVAKKLDLPFVVGKFENGGDNQTIFTILESLRPFISNNNVYCVVIQFSDAGRSLVHDYDEKLGSIDEQIELQVSRIDKICKESNLSWIGFSWQEDIGNILKENYNENYIPLIQNGIEYTNFSWIENVKLKPLFLSNTYPIKDDHFNIDGHKFISEMIYDKIMKRSDLVETLKNYKNYLINK